jgi:hypothetical protein
VKYSNYNWSLYANTLKQANLQLPILKQLLFGSVGVDAEIAIRASKTAIAHLFISPHSFALSPRIPKIKTHNISRTGGRKYL